MKLNLLNVTSTEYDADLVRHFVEHYSQFNIDEWHIILHNGSDQEQYEVASLYKSLRPNIRFHKWDGIFLSSEKVKLFNTVKNSFEGYVLLADVDELQEWPQEPKDMLLKQPVIGGYLVDRLPLEGKVKKVENSPNLFKQFPIESNVSYSITNGYKHKPCVFHKNYEIINSHDLRLYENPVYYTDSTMIRISHFKFTDTRKAKTQRRYTEYKQANLEGHAVNYKESEQLLGWLDN